MRDKQFFTTITNYSFNCEKVQITITIVFTYITISTNAYKKIERAHLAEYGLEIIDWQEAQSPLVVEVGQFSKLQANEE
ncbi:hypothetical protein [Neobacillus drentensis]|uniref:hypothetical protein n=1 Tax=Neobacillus drentensis TaxID=220684 RepID=UPI002FFF559B